MRRYATLNEYEAEALERLLKWIPEVKRIVEAKDWELYRSFMAAYKDFKKAGS